MTEATPSTSVSQLWDALYAWASGVLPGVPVIESHDNGPSPDGTYICIDYSGNWRAAETAPSRQIAGRPELPAPKVYTYRGSVQVREVEGDGELLLQLAESLSGFEVGQAFSAAGISVLKTSGPSAMPALQQTKWKRESLLTLEIAWARGYEGSSAVIESVEINQEVIEGEISSP